MGDPSCTNGGLYYNSNSSQIRACLNGAWKSLTGVLTQITSAVTVISTVTETNLVNYTIPAGTIGTDKRIVIKLRGDFVQNIGGAESMNLRVKLGATTIYESGAGATGYLRGVDYGASAVRRRWSMDIEIKALASASSQYMSGWALNYSNSTVPTTGQGVPRLANAVATQFGSNGATSVDLSAAQALVVSVQPDTNSASWELKMYEAEVAVE